MSDRRIADLTPAMRPKAQQFVQQADARLAPSWVAILTTWRTPQEQAVAHASGLSNAAPGHYVIERAFVG